MAVVQAPLCRLLSPAPSVSPWADLVHVRSFFPHSGWGVGCLGGLGALQCLLWGWPSESPEELCGPPAQERWCPVPWGLAREGTLRPAALPRGCG